MKKLVMGVLAHVDSGKTTLSENLLYSTGSIRKLGRVDHGDTALDTNEIEKERGITVFSKQAVLKYNNLELCLLDTPGHVDFGREAERTLQVLDCAVLIVSSLDGIQNHTVTLWKLLENYNVPTFIFVNKMDLQGSDKNLIMANLKKEFGTGCVDFSGDNISKYEEMASVDESAIEEFFTTENLSDETVSDLIFKRKLFPCLFGSALKNIGTTEFLDTVAKYAQNKEYGDKFGARVFKITFDDANTRLTFLKVTGGSLKVKDSIEQIDRSKDKHTEKINQIRIYTGDKFEAVNEVTAGSVCAVTGLSFTYQGQGLGEEKSNDVSMLQAIFSYRVNFDSTKHDVRNILMNLRILEDEEPQLHVIWNEQTKEIHLNLMGEVQLEVIKTLFYQRFGAELSFDAGSVLYKETIMNTVEGVGHFEPLRHYAEVHLLMESQPVGTGLVFDTLCSEDMLDRNWQRLILTHLMEKPHLGVLTGSPITDMKITLVKGRAHLKHTEGGDFRQATYRAVRNGLMQAESQLLEPWYDFTITVPTDSIGRVMTDVQKMSGTFDSPETDGEMTTITGTAPVSEINSYNSQLVNFTHGKGRISLKLKGYLPCHNAEQVIAQISYDAEGDVDNTADSVFCSHGAGHVVKWYDVPDNMHLESFLKPKIEETETEEDKPKVSRRQVRRYATSLEDDKELLQIFESTYGKIKTDKYLALKTPAKEKKKTEEISQPIFVSKNHKTDGKDYLLVDGYNIIFAWDELASIARDNFEAARHILANRLCNYRGFKKQELILVFDAYKVKGNVGEIMKYHNITVVYTKEAETADMYIEKVTREIGRKHNVRVATSDGLEQIIILGHGALRLSANAFHEEVAEVEKAIREYLQ